MNYKKYIHYLAKKRIHNLKPFRINKLWIDHNDLEVKVVQIKTIENLKEYVLDLYDFENFAYCVQNIFYLKEKFKHLDADLIIFDNYMNIVDLKRTINREINIVSLNEPLNVLILLPNTINYFNIEIGQKINFEYIY